jgi:hypothetical protein
VLSGSTEVRIEQQRALTQLRKAHREIRGQRAGTRAAACCTDGKCLAAVIEPSQRKLAAQDAKRLSGQTEGLIRADEHRIEPALAATDVRVIELSSERTLDVIVVDETQASSCLTEAHTLLSLQRDDATDVVLGQLPSFGK